MEIVGVTENENGGATYTVELNSEEADEMCRNGIIWAIVSAATGLTVEEAMKYSKYGLDDAPEHNLTERNDGDEPNGQ